MSTFCKLTEDSFLVLPMCDLISFAPCGETFLLILTLPQPFQRVCSIGVLAGVVTDVSIFKSVSKLVLSIGEVVEIEAVLDFLRIKDLILLIVNLTYLFIITV